MGVLGDFIYRFLYVVERINKLFIKTISLFILVIVTIGIKDRFFFYINWNYNRYSKLFFLIQLSFPSASSILVIEMV